MATIMNPIINFDEVMNFLREPKKVFFDISWEGDAISYYRTKRMLLPDVCPICRKKESLMAVRVIMDNGIRLRPYITPVCKRCWSNKTKNMNLTPFFVARFFLCPNVNFQKTTHRKI